MNELSILDKIFIAAVMNEEINDLTEEEIGYVAVETYYPLTVKDLSELDLFIR